MEHELYGKPDSTFPDHANGRSEVIVKAKARDIECQTQAVGKGVRGRSHTGVDAGCGYAAKINKQILGFDAPLAPHISLDAATDDIAGFRAGDRCRFRAGRKGFGELEIAVQRGECGATGGVEQPIAAGKAETTAQRCQPVDVGARRYCESVARPAGNGHRPGTRAAAQMQPLDIAFDAGEVIAGLPVIAGINAPDNGSRFNALRTGGIECGNGGWAEFAARHFRGGGRRIEGSPGPAGETADIETAPV